jgi:hypothetical protein
MPTGTLGAYVAEGAAFVDIGTPEGLARAAALLPRHPPARKRA